MTGARIIGKDAGNWYDTFTINKGSSDGIEKDILFVQMSPQELYERKVSNEELYTAINELPEKQAKRIYARFFQSMSISDIARIEGVAVSSVKESIDRGLKKISKILKNI